MGLDDGGGLAGDRRRARKSPSPGPGWRGLQGMGGPRMMVDREVRAEASGSPQQGASHPGPAEPRREGRGWGGGGISAGRGSLLREGEGRASLGTRHESGPAFLLLYPCALCTTMNAGASARMVSTPSSLVQKGRGCVRVSGRAHCPCVCPQITRVVWVRVFHVHVEGRGG